jgi:hypothetical protein
MRVQILALCVAVIAACTPSAPTSQSDPTIDPAPPQPEVTTDPTSQPKVTTSDALMLTAKDQTTLKGLGIAIAVPTAVPTGYTVSKVETEPCPAESPRSAEGTCRFGPQYNIVYRNAEKDSCFTIRETGGGVGGPSGEYRQPFDTPLFGESALQFGETGSNTSKTPSAEQLDSPQPNMYTDWSTKSKDPSGPPPFYSLAGGDASEDNKSETQCLNTITPNEAIKIVQSMTWLE